jgi:hypothetical protein
VSECSWCGRAVPPGDGYRAFGPDGRATFCRLEHVVPWAIRGAAWEGEPGEAPRPDACSWCEREPARIALDRTRGEHHVTDGFCSVDHLLAWAKAGGRYR